MFHHIVLFTQKKEARSLEIENALKDLRTLLSSVQEVKEWSVEKVFESRPRAYQYIQYTIFQNKAGLENYRNHPDHETIKLRLKELFVYEVIDY
jgi:hypothetical protein